ncbi:acyltransferase [uncultured Eggerthella sp.]|uniref:acyltransferase n=1 Tax=uncultured Eggerthella sp. TaxID=293422 RepID=UPI00258D8BB2|nr:acyltransferase [uncultured Eggerthella sp.]
MMEFAERLVCKLYRLVKMAFLRSRYGSRLDVGGGAISFRKPFFCRLGPQGCMRLGRGAFFNYGCKIIAHERIEIGSDCLFGPNVQVFDFDHGHDRSDIAYKKQGMETKPVVIGNNVWLGANVVVLKGVTIGDNAIVGAGTIMSHDVPPDVTVYSKQDIRTVHH